MSIVVVLLSIAVVMHRSNRDSKVVDCRCIRLSQCNLDSIVVDLLDTFDVVSGIAGLDTKLIISIGGHQFINTLVGFFGVDGCCIVAAVSFEDRICEIFFSCAFFEFIAPVRSNCFDRVFLCVGTIIVDQGISDILNQCDHRSVEFFPELGLCRFIPIGEVLVVLAGSDHQVELGVHTFAVRFHTFDGLRVEDGRTIEGRVSQDVHREDDVVSCERLTVGELDVVTKLEDIVGRAVIILVDGQIRNTFVLIFSTVVLSGLACLAFLDDLAKTVITEQVDAGHGRDILVISRLREERGELAREVRVANDERFVRISAGAAACSEGRCEDHHKHEDKC